MKIHFTIEDIKAWRKKQYDAGLPCEYKDFYIAHGVCSTCNGKGSTLSTYPQPCQSCNGKGNFNEQSS